MLSAAESSAVTMPAQVADLLSIATTAQRVHSSSKRAIQPLARREAAAFGARGARGRIDLAGHR